jgi:hypothetical protein
MKAGLFNKLCKIVAMVASMLVMSSAVFAAEGSAEFIGNIHQGNWQFGVADFSIAEHIPAYEDSYHVISASLPVQYFLVDRFSLGIISSVSYNSQNKESSAIGFGPAFNAYVYAKDRLAVFFGGNLEWNRATDYADYYSSNAHVGLDFFATPAVAIGPQFNWNHWFESEDSYTFNQLNLSVNFKIFL